LKSLGPDVITGAADDDPSGIATYSVAGAQLGTELLWTALFTWPLIAAVQMMCARQRDGARLGCKFQAAISHKQSAENQCGPLK
jgi:Mn2+/Fe2+ NRAMP family transporter